MLRQLDIRNYTIIENLQVDFHPGFSVITGETGAGKSIILGAIGLLVGNRADGNILRNADKKCIIEAKFDINGYQIKQFFDENELEYDTEECIVRREIAPSGKSRGFINDTPVALQLMRQLGDILLDVHSQHQNLLLRKEDFQLNTLDIIARHSDTIGEYKNAYTAYQHAIRQLNDETERIRQSKDSEDYLRFQLNELENATLSDDEEESLENEISILAHAEEIKESLYTAEDLLGNEDGIIERLKRISHELARINRVMSSSEKLAERIETTLVEIKDIEQEVATQLSRIDFNPSDLDEKQQRLDLIQSLKRKHHRQSITDLLHLQQELALKVEGIDHSEEVLEQLRKNVQEKEDLCRKFSAELTDKRKKAARTIEKQMTDDLQQLGIPKVMFSIDMQEKELAPDGADKVVFLFSANKDIPMQPISQVASGGEISRVMLCLKSLISHSQNLPTIIFDEIDTGISGAIAEKMANIMRNMGQSKRQVISITHLPQIAAMGEHHYRVTKQERDDRTVSNMVELAPEQRIDEIAQMLSGTDISSAAIENAKHLLRL